MNNDLAEYLGLWASAFTSASLLPGTSEVVLAALWFKKLNVIVLWCVATSGNVAGSYLNYWLGLQCHRFSAYRWFPVKPAEFARAQQWMHKFGSFGLLLSWLPVVGDPLTLMAGVFRLPVWRFLTLVVIAKGGRYALLLYFADELLTHWISR